MGKVILSVEDDENNLMLIRELLQINGYTVLEARNGKEGVEVAEEKNPDLILMDIHMPVMDGFTATRILKEGESTKMIPVIAISAYGMEGGEEKLCETGFDAYISKPLDFKKFLETIAEYVKK